MNRKALLAAATVAAIAGTTGCAVHETEGASPFQDGDSMLDPTTVWIENHGLATVAIYSATSSARIGTVMPGQGECLDLQTFDRPSQLIARPIGGGEATVSPRFSPTGGDGWSWRLGNQPNLDRMSLEGAPRCD